MRDTARLLLGLVGASDVLAGISLLITPAWFYEHVGPYAPFNQHYEGDAGAFVIGIGLCLLLAAVRPAGAGRLVVVAGIASLFHLGNHVYATLYSGATWASTLLVAVQAVAVVVGGLGLRDELKDGRLKP